MELLEYLRPTLKSLLLPPGLLVCLLLGGLLFYRRLLGKLMAWSGLSLLYLLSTPAAEQWLGEQLETTPPVLPAQLIEANAEAILLLTAGLVDFNPELDDQPRPSARTLQRLDYAAHLHQQTGLPIIISGGSINATQTVLAEVAADWLQKRLKIEPLALETRSTTTWENAQYSAALLDELGVEKVAVVTHAFHMPRAMLAMQQHSINAIAAPFLFTNGNTPDAHQMKGPQLWRPSYDSLSRNHLAIHEFLGIFWYQLKSAP